MFTVVLFEPEIPPNTGNIIRLCANTGCHLQLIEPLGFALDDKRLRRAGLDYGEWCGVERFADYGQWLAATPGARRFALTTKGAVSPGGAGFQAGDFLLFGPESRGLPKAILAEFPAERRLRLPMRPESRSLNLSNAAAVVVYEAWRQLDYAGAAPPPRQGGESIPGAPAADHSAGV